MVVVTFYSDFGAPQIKSLTVSTVSPTYLPWSNGTRCHILVFWMLSFKPTFSLFSFIIKGLFSSLLFAIRMIVICISEVTDISPGDLDSTLCFIHPCILHDAFFIGVKQSGWQYAALAYSFPNFEPDCCSMSGCFLICIQISQEAGKVVWYTHLLKSFPEFVGIHTVKGFVVINKAEIDVFLELLAFSMIQWMLAISTLAPLPF